MVVVPQRWTPHGEAEVDLQDGRKLLVWQGIPGEEARVYIDHVGQHQVIGKFREVQSPHVERVQPQCDRYSLCGGCPWMHLTAKGQADGRHDLLLDALEAEGLDVPVDELIPSPDGLEGFRHVIKLGFGHSDEGRIRVGAWGRGNRRVVPIPECNTAAPVLKKVMAAVAHHSIELGLHPFEADTGRGVMRAAVLRASRTTGEVLVTLVVGKHVKDVSVMAEEVANQVNAVVGVWLHLNDGPGNAIFGRDGTGVVGVKPINGKAYIEETLNGVTYRIGPGDFFQTNPGMAEVLYRQVVEDLRLADGVPLVDLYCGVGGIALLGAKTTGWALGVEEVEGAVLRAREAALAQKIPAEFVAGQVLEVLPEVEKRLKGARPAVAVNPARRGLEDGVVDAIAKLDPRRIAYVSCNPKAMARDLALFRAKGFTIGPVKPYDMFPNTPHVETVTILEGAKSETESRRAPKRKVVRQG